MLTLAHPLVLLLLPLPLLLHRLISPRRPVRPLVMVPFGDRIRSAGGGRSGSTQAVPEWLRILTAALIWLLVIAALTRPQWLEPPVTRELPTRDLLLLVDLSTSMRQQDFTGAAGEPVDRLTAVKEVLADFLSRREGDRIGLVVFGSAPYLQAPFSTDLNISRQLLAECAIGMAGPRTAFGDAIGLAITLFEDSDLATKTIIALTDGNDTDSQVPPVEAARLARSRGIRLHTVAIGDPTTVGEDRLDEEALKQVAEIGGGSYFFAADRQRLEAIYAELDRLETRQVETVSHQPRRDLFFWPLLAALVLSMIEKAACLLLHHGARSAGPAVRPIQVDPRTGRLEMRR